MAKTNNFIELNGKRYDALTGAFLGTVRQAEPTHQPVTHTPKLHNRGTALDGVIPKKTEAKVTQLIPHKPTVHHVKTLAAHKPERAKTLRRDIVKPPTLHAKKSLKLQPPTDLVQHKPGVLTVVPKLSSDIVDPFRASRALTVPRSPQVVRFRQQPLPRHRSAATPAPVYTHHPIDGVNRSPTLVAPRHAPTGHGRRDNDIFEHAIAYARSHEQLSPKELDRHATTRRNRKHKRVIGVFASVLMVAALSGFIFWQNRADIELQLASARSGVPASMPAYRPGGYAIGGLTYSPGTVTIGFHSTSGNFNVVQRTSNWDSETLLQNYVATSGQAYNTYQAGGRTIYVYGNGNATWVNGGIWYQVNDNGLLNKSQVINLATSM